MRRGLALGLVVGWLLGVGTALAGVVVTGGWYEHRWHERWLCELNKACDIAAGSEVVPGQPAPCYLRRPRFVLRW